MSQPQDLYRCPTCGASLSLDDLRGTDCKYCKTVFPHHARAAQHAVLVNQVMQQQIHQANQMGYGYGMPPHMHYGAPAFGAATDAAVRGSMIGLFVALGVVVALVLIGGAAAFLLFV
jgi:sulfite exporter TauE/SafE